MRLTHALVRTERRLLKWDYFTYQGTGVIRIDGVKVPNNPTDRIKSIKMTITIGLGFPAPRLSATGSVSIG